MNICVFLSAADLDERYTGPALAFAELVGARGSTLVWGGSDTGLMKQLLVGPPTVKGVVYEAFGPSRCSWVKPAPLDSISQEPRQVSWYRSWVRRPAGRLCFVR